MASVVGLGDVVQDEWVRWEVGVRGSSWGGGAGARVVFVVSPGSLVEASRGVASGWGWPAWHGVAVGYGDVHKEDAEGCDGEEVGRCTDGWA